MGIMIDLSMVPALDSPALASTGTADPSPASPAVVAGAESAGTGSEGTGVEGTGMDDEGGGVGSPRLLIESLDERCGTWIWRSGRLVGARYCSDACGAVGGCDRVLSRSIGWIRSDAGDAR